MFWILMMAEEWMPTPRIRLDTRTSCLFVVSIVLNIMQFIRIYWSCFGLSIIAMEMENFDCKGKGRKNMVVWAKCGINYHVGLWEGFSSKGLGCPGRPAMTVT